MHLVTFQGIHSRSRWSWSRNPTISRCFHVLGGETVSLQDAVSSSMSKLWCPCLSAVRAEGPPCYSLGWSEQRERRPRSPAPRIPLRPEGPEQIGLLPCTAHAGRRGLFGKFTWGFALGASPQAVTVRAFSHQRSRPEYARRDANFAN